MAGNQRTPLVEKNHQTTHIDTANQHIKKDCCNDCLAQTIESFAHCCDSDCCDHDKECVGKCLAITLIAGTLGGIILIIALVDTLPCHINWSPGSDTYDDTVRIGCSDNNLTFWNMHNTSFNIGGNCYNYTCTSDVYPAVCQIQPEEDCMITVFFNAAQEASPNLFLLAAAILTGFAGLRDNYTPALLTP